MTRALQRKAAFTFGIFFIMSMLVLALFVPNPTPFQYLVFRVVLSLAAAGVAAMIPGFIELNIPNWIRAGGALAVFLIVFFYNPASLVADPAKPQRVDAIKRLVDDLEQVKVLLPPDKVLSDCLRAKSGEGFFNAFETCDSESKRNHTHALNLLDRNWANLKLFLPVDQLKIIQKQLEAIRFAVYEMHNNHLAKKRWQSEGCPASIQFIDSSSLNKLPRDDQGRVKCTLSVEDYDDFLNKRERTDDRFSSIVSRTISKTNAKTFIVPGDRDTIEDYFLRSNKQLYNSMLRDMEKLLDDLKELLAH
jgi:hypothetical protein